LAAREVVKVVRAPLTTAAALYASQQHAMSSSWSFDDEFRALAESRAAANIKNPVGMVSVKESAEDTGTKVARSNKELLLKVRVAGVCRGKAHAVVRVISQTDAGSRALCSVLATSLRGLTAGHRALLLAGQKLHDDRCGGGQPACLPACLPACHQAKLLSDVAGQEGREACPRCSLVGHPRAASPHGGREGRCAALTLARARCPAAGLMLWMTGSGINIFTIMFTVMAMVNPLKSIAGVNQQFQRYSDGGKLDLTQQKFVFVALHLVALGVGLWKVRATPTAAASGPPLSARAPAPDIRLRLLAVLFGRPQCQGLGLLPTTVSDWATFETVARPVQYSSGSFV
jgi:hypothetical protein